MAGEPVNGRVIALPVAPWRRRRARVREVVAQIAEGLPRDARIWQIAFLATLLAVGVLARDFTLKPEQMALAFAAGLATQAAWLRALGLRHRGVLSAVVTCLGLALLLRADNLWVHPLAAAIAISSKFVVRCGGKHVLNPGNFGVIAGVALLPGTWVSPGQWGSDLALAALVVALGGLVTARAKRVDIAWVFLAAWLGLVAARVAWLGQPWAVWAHQLASGALMLFAFFMISDPMTIPNATRGRVVYATVVAAIAAFWTWGLWRPNALVWALFVATPLVPLLDRVWPARRYEWR